MINIIVWNKLEKGNKFYLFWSFLHSKQYNDVDVLVVYRDNIKEIIKCFDEIGNKFPVHITSLTEQEEKELNFIKKYGCVRLT